jgi:hypothetical protein
VQHQQRDKRPLLSDSAEANELVSFFLNVWWPLPLFLDIFFISFMGTVLRLMRSRFIYNNSRLLVGFVGWMWASIAWMHWSCTDEFVRAFKSVEELYPSFPLGVDSAETSQLPKEKNYNTSK